MNHALQSLLRFQPAPVDCCAECWRLDLEANEGTNTGLGGGREPLCSWCAREAVWNGDLEYTRIP